MSGADGRYRFSGLAVGRYAVTAVVGNWQTSTIIAKRGTNRWQFTVGGYYAPDSRRGDLPNVEHPSSTRKYDTVAGFDEQDELDVFVSASGPLIRDRLLAYAIYDFRSIDERIHNAWGRMHEDVDGDGFWGVKLDWLLTDSHRFEYTGFSDDRTVERTSYRWDEETDMVGDEIETTDFERGGVNHIFAYRGHFGPRVAASVLWGTGRYDLKDTSSSDENCPVAIDSRSGEAAALGCWTRYYAKRGQDDRDIVRADFEWAVGEHHLLRFVPIGKTRARSTAPCTRAARTFATSPSRPVKRCATAGWFLRV